MKSETHIKIKQSRQKYFQEIISMQVEEHKEKPQGDETQPQAEPQPEHELDLGRVLKDLIENLPAVSMPVIISREKRELISRGIGQRLSRISKWIASIGQWISEAVDRRTEKTRSRLYAYMLLLFDA
jgi:hypothetical protein